MMKLCTIGGSILFGYAAGYFAAPLGFMWAFLLSGVGSVVGIWAGWKLARHIERG